MSFRPAGMSDDDSDDDDYGFYEKPVRQFVPQENFKKKIENELQNAIINGSIDDVEKIIISDLNNNINDKLDTGWTPLMHACFHAQEDIVVYLLDKGADPNMQSDSVTPVMLTCSNSNVSDEVIDHIVTKLVEKGAILNIGDKYGQTPLMRAVTSGRVALVRKLLEMKVNIEMRDRKGWTAAFVAVQQNQPFILELLIENGARITEVDRSDRTLLDIAQTVDFEEILEVLQRYLPKEETDDLDVTVNEELRCWQDYYPGHKKGDVPNYKSEIPSLLYGMNCERLAPIICNSGITLRQFLLLDEEQMVKLGIDLPFERQRLRAGLKNFHTRGWKLKAVAGLYAVKKEDYSVLDCLTTLGNHLQQVFILEATLQYTVRAYNKVQDQLKFEPPDSPTIEKLKVSSKKMITNINSIRHQVKNMKRLLVKISKNNPPPTDFIKERSYTDIAVECAKKVFIVCSLTIVVYKAKGAVTNLLK